MENVKLISMTGKLLMKNLKLKEFMRRGLLGFKLKFQKKLFYIEHL